MTLITSVRLERGLQLKLARHLLHDGVAAAAHQAACLVRTAVPIRSIAPFMATKANRVALFNSPRLVVRTVGNKPTNAAPPASIYVCRAGAVAAFTLELAFLGFGEPAHQCVVELGRLVRMAGRAHLRTDACGVYGNTRPSSLVPGLVWTGGASDAFGVTPLWKNSRSASTALSASANFVGPLNGPSEDGSMLSTYERKAV